MFNIVAAELIFAAIFPGVLLLTWPDQPWGALFSKALFLALDLVFRPPSRDDFVTLDAPGTP